MTPGTIQKEIEDATVTLLELAREVSWNKIDDNCKFILTEIRNSEENYSVQRKLLKRVNDKKVPATLPEIMPALQRLYEHMYDINLHIYKATKKLTIVDIRYYLRSAFSSNNVQDTLPHSPMLHCKAAIPPWLGDKKEKYDINWEHKEWVIRWKMFWERQKFRVNRH